MKTVRFFIVLIFSIFFAFSVPSASANEKTAIDFVKELSDKAISNVVNADVDNAEKTKRFRKLFEEAADIPTIGRFVLGRHWRKATKKERTSFIKAFKEIVVLSWSRRFDDYAVQTIEFINTRETGRKEQVYVESKVIQNTGDIVNVDWRLRKKNDAYKIIDINIASASMALTYKKEYSSVIKNTGKGVKGLIETLEKKITQMIEEEQSKTSAAHTE
ncbi:MAG: ABC transporter substrate-binding protein [Alphaproteobacteria bacterium]|nr:ABC transporter substrate-binding protein [Alphaproteobacteria bacterium]